MNIIQQMRIYINSHGISQYEFAKRVGMTQKRVNGIMLLRIKMNDEERGKIERFFNANS